MIASISHQPATPRQRALLGKLTLSSAFSPQEADQTLRWLASDAATKAAATVLIDRALARIKQRNAQAAAAKERQEARRQAQDDAKAAIIAETGQWTGVKPAATRHPTGSMSAAALDAKLEARPLTKFDCF